MKIKPEQLTQHLKQGLAPIYLIGGNEPLLVQEACDAIQQQAQQQAYPPRESLTVDQHFDWDDWVNATKSLSLFSTKRYFQLRLPDKITKKISDPLIAYTTAPTPDTLVVFVSNRLDSRSKWIKAIEQQGVVIPIWPITAAYLPRWLQQRLQQQQLTTSSEGLQQLATQVENNLLAAQQAIAKLKLIYGEGHITPDQITACLGQDAKYDIFQWMDSLLLGHVEKMRRQFHTLKAMGTEPILLLWALAKEIRQLVQLSHHIQQGQSPAQALQQMSIWPKRRPLFQQALKRHDLPHWQQCLAAASKLDQMLKGAVTGDSWDHLETLAFKLCGKEVL